MLPILLLLVALVLAPPAAADPVEYLRTEHWAYEDLNALWSRGVVDSLNMLVRPWSRIEIARSLKAARERNAAIERDPVYRRLARQFSRELHWLGMTDVRPETAPLIELAEEKKEIRFQVGIDGIASGSPPSKMQFEAGSGAVVQAKGYFWPSFYAGTEIWAQRTESDREIGDSLIKNEDLFLAARESYFTFAPSYFDFLFGLTETRWGPGSRGTLLLSDAAEPYATLRLNTRIAGLELTAMHGGLIQSDQRYFAAHRLTYSPIPNLYLGLSEAVRYNAQSPELLYVVNLIPYTLVERYLMQNRENDDPEISTRNNIILGIDAAWRVRPGLRIYGEFLADEISTERANIPHRLGWQLGVSLNPTLGGAPLELAFEYSKVFRYTYAVFYDRNFIFSEEPLGFEGGPDTEHYSVRVKVDPTINWSAVFDLGLIRQGEGYLGEYWDPAEPQDAWSGLDLSGVVASTLRAAAGLAWTPRDNVRAEVGIGLRHVRNVNHVDGTNETDPEAFFRLTARK
jgi:hypothetical protein